MDNGEDEPEDSVDLYSGDMEGEFAPSGHVLNELSSDEEPTCESAVYLTFYIFGSLCQTDYLQFLRCVQETGRGSSSRSMRLSTTLLLSFPNPQQKFNAVQVSVSTVCSLLTSPSITNEECPKPSCCCCC